MAPQVAHAYIGWNEVFATPPPGDGLAYYFRRLPRRWLINALGQIGTTLFNSGMFYQNPQQQIGFIRSFRKLVSYDERVWRLIARGEGHLAVHPDLIAALTKYAILYGCDDEIVPSYACDYLLRAILLFSSLYGAARGGDKVGTVTPAIFLDYELEAVLSVHENFSFSIARYYKFFEWAKAQAIDLADYLSLDADFQSFFGMSYEQFATATFCVVSPFMNRYDLSEWYKQAGFFDVRVLTSTLTNTRYIDAVLSMLSIDIAAAKTNMEERPRRYGLSDLRPFIDRPLLKTEDYIYACPYQGFLRNKLGTGLFFALFDEYRKRGGKDHLRLARFFGRYLEAHLYDLVRDGARARPDVQVFPEVVYRGRNGESKSSDIVFIAGATAVFMDVTRKRLRLDETICDRDAKALTDDVAGMFVKKARQIHRSIQDFQSGLYQLGNVPPETIERYIPVVITEQDIPQIIALPDHIRSEMEKLNLPANYAAVQLIAAEDIEVLYTSGIEDLDEILWRKASKKEYCYRDLPSYLYDLERQRLAPSSNEASIPGYDDFSKKVVMPTVREWGLRADR